MFFLLVFDIFLGCNRHVFCIASRFGRPVPMSTYHSVIASIQSPDRSCLASIWNRQITTSSGVAHIRHL
jgi:hypothetical protein